MQYTVHRIQYTVYTEGCKSVSSIGGDDQYTVYSIQHTGDRRQYAVHSIQCTGYSIQYTVYNTLYDIKYVVAGYR